MNDEHLTRRHRRRRTDPTTDPRYLERRHERRRRGTDASGGWRTERRHQHVPQAVRTDGGRPGDAPERDDDDATTTLPAVGAIVADRERDDAGPAVVVATHPESAADDWRIDALDGATVADVNLGYPADDPIVTVAFVDDLPDDPDPGTPTLPMARERGEDALDVLLTNSDAKTYDYPASRLSTVEGPPRTAYVRRPPGDPTLDTDGGGSDE